MKNPEVSIILVHYMRPDILKRCILSIFKYTKGLRFEVIIVDNSEKGLTNFWQKSSRRIKYIRSPNNIGYAAGNNLGVKNASSQNIFILNPDTLCAEDILSKLIVQLRENKKTGIVAPMLIDKNHNEYLQIGIKELSPLRSMVVLSFINKIFPNNSVSRSYWGRDIDFKSHIEVDTVAGSAFMIKREVFELANGFDENFFLFFEELDLCKRVRELGYKVILMPELNILHYWAATTPKSKKINKIFAESRFYYFKKHFGITNAVLVEMFANLSLKKLIIWASKG